METIELYTQFIMYYEIYRLRNEEGFSVRGIAKQLKINFRTVKKYLKMTLEDFELFLMSKSERHRVTSIDKYSEFGIGTTVKMASASTVKNQKMASRVQ